MSGVDVIVVDYRTPDDLEGFLVSFAECAAPEDRLHVVLVSPMPEDAAVVSKWVSHPQLVSTTVMRDNVGYGRACNEAAMLATQPVIGFFNADTRLSPGITAAVAEQLAANPTWGIAGPRQVNDFGLLVHAGIVGTNKSCAPRAWMRPDRDERHRQVEPVISVAGAAYFIKRDVWAELTACPVYQQFLEANGAPLPWGAFLPTPLYYEETWCSYHARAHGHQVMYLGDLVMVHRWHKSIDAAGGEPTMKYQQAQNMFRVCCEAHGIEHD